MRLRLVVGAVAPLLLLIGCGSQIGLSGQAREDYLKSIKPYGAHWIKEGMTRESRRVDLSSCGSPDGEEVRFSAEQINEERLVNEPNGVAAYLRLRNKVGLCMQGKGYVPIGDLVYLGGCDVRCLYP